MAGDSGKEGGGRGGGSSGGGGKQEKKGWPHLIAGGAAGCSAVLLLHPFDVIKTRLQVQDGVPGALPVYRGTAHAARTILATEGWAGLYAGLTPSLIGSTVSWGAYLYLYDRIKAWHRQRQGLAGGGEGGQQQQQHQQQQRLSATWNLLSAAQAGAMVCLLTNPIWLVKTRLALQQCSAAPAAAAPGGAYRGVVDALVRIGRAEGLRGYYRGFGPSLVLQTAHGAIQFAAYEELKALAARAGTRSPSDPDRQLGALEVSGYGAASKLLAAVSTYPTQVVRSRLQQRSEGRALVYSSSWQAVSLTWRREGLAGFYKGLAPSLLRVMPQSAVTLAVYEGLLGLLERRAAADEAAEAGERVVAPRQAGAGGGGGGGGSAGSGAGGGGGAASARLQLEQEQRRRQADEERQRERQQQRVRHASLVEQMRPLIVAADSQAEQ